MQRVIKAQHIAHINFSELSESLRNNYHTHQTLSEQLTILKGNVEAQLGTPANDGESVGLLSGYKVIETPRDGDCLFTTIAYILNFNQPDHSFNALIVRQRMNQCLKSIVSYLLDLSDQPRKYNHTAK